MAQVIVYENGNAIGGEGHPTYARDITFENEGTDLVSEQTNDAIKEVNEKTKHGIVELWKNSSPSSNFAGQTIQIANFDTTKYDAVILTIQKHSGETMDTYWDEHDVELFVSSAVTSTIEYIAMSLTQFEIYRMARSVTFSMSGTTLNIQFADNGIWVTSGGTPTTVTDNQWNVPYRILGLIHND